MIEIAAGLFAHRRRLLPHLGLAVYTQGLKAAEGGNVAIGVGLKRMAQMKRGGVEGVGI